MTRDPRPRIRCPFCVGTVGNDSNVEIVETELGNVPTPAVYDPEVFSWAEPSRHSA